MKQNKKNKDEEEEYYERQMAVSMRYGNGIPMDPVALATTMNELDESEIQECLEDYYYDNNNPIF